VKRPDKLMQVKQQPPKSDENPNPSKWKALATVAMGTMMATMDASITNIAFPVLTRVFQTDLTIVMWVTVAYILVSTSLMLVIGKISDLVGRKRIYVCGMALFTLGLVACSLAHTMSQLIFFRALQGAGAAMTIACGTAIVAEAFPSKEVGKGLGFLGVSVSFGFIVGPILGGLLLDWLNWRAIFYARIPLGLAALLMAMALLERDRIYTGRINLDIMGTLTSAAGIFLFVLGVSQLRNYGPFSLRLYSLVGPGLLFIILFVLFERRAKDPIVDLSLFKNRVFSSAMGAIFLFFVAAPSFILIMPFYLIQGLLLTPSEAGLLMAVTSATTLVFGPLSGALSDRFGAVWFAALGAGVVGVAFVFMLGFGPETRVTEIIPVLALLGVGVGTFQPSNNSIIMGSVPRNRLGTASALIATHRQVGIAVGMAFGGTVFSARRIVHQGALTKYGLESSYAEGLSVSLAFHDVLLISAFIIGIGAILSLVRAK
jgi:EmrB/QacA subfamily drug resistance transporter